MHKITRVSLKPIIKQSSQQLTAFLARFKFFEQTLDRCSGFASFMVDTSRLFRAPSLRRRDASAEVKERPNHQRNSKKVVTVGQSNVTNPATRLFCSSLCLSSFIIFFTNRQ